LPFGVNSSLKKDLAIKPHGFATLLPFKGVTPSAAIVLPF